MIGPEYKAERLKRGLTQSALASLVGVRQATISARERDEIEITKEAELAVKSLPVPRGKGHNDPEHTPTK
jgi:transcriptional regulator with XRE-family HTH domain